MTQTTILPNGLRIILYPSNSPVSYCGFAINAGTRDEETNEFGLAHFVEHTLFKGTRNRKPWHILNRMEVVGGELNAYTTKEETFLYSISLSDDIERSIELLSDLVFHAVFPESEIEKEKEVVLDEIHSYEDNPSELIFDEFENQLFGNHAIGHSILGTENCVKSFSADSCRDFTGRFYSPENMVFFFYGQTSPQKIIRLAEKYMTGETLSSVPADVIRKNREKPLPLLPIRKKMDKQLHQSHVILGNRSYGIHNPNRIGLYLLNNILGGPGMNSRLNLSLREKNGLVYSVESGMTSYSDTGIFHIYFACDSDSLEKGLRLTHKELKKLCDNELTSSQLQASVKQLKGQLGISAEHRENTALGMGKSFLHCNKYEELSQLYQKLDALNTKHLLEIANEIFDEKHFFQLIFE